MSLSAASLSQVYSRLNAAFDETRNAAVVEIAADVLSRSEWDMIDSGVSRVLSAIGPQSDLTPEVRQNLQMQLRRSFGELGMEQQLGIVLSQADPVRDAALRLFNWLSGGEQAPDER
jgi:hypothetical protein